MAIPNAVAVKALLGFEQDESAMLLNDDTQQDNL